MNRIAMRTALPLIAAGAVLLAGAGASAAAPVDEPTPAEGAEILLDDGRVVGDGDGDGDTITFTFEGEESKARKGDMGVAACPEVNHRPTYTVKGSPYVTVDEKKQRAPRKGDMSIGRQNS
ncbi:hypothetical protein [Streptomyces sp. C10-9-1]|uniref:hypothetical protein n=1 Tax=Streptomyces sp. C10-9-1 TaxID=1859285 RepID=UPI003D72DB91